MKHLVINTDFTYVVEHILRSEQLVTRDQKPVHGAQLLTIHCDDVSQPMKYWLAMAEGCGLISHWELKEAPESKKLIAVQFLCDHHPWPVGVHLWTNECRPRDGSWGYIQSMASRIHVHHGDWIVTSSDGTISCYSPETYAELKKQCPNIEEEKWHTF